MRNVAVVASGTAGAQAIAIAFSPVITRLYGPEAFGLLGTFLALVALISPIAAFCYPIAIVLPKNDNEAIGIIRLSIILSLVLAVFLISVFLVAGDELMDLFGAGAVAAFAWLIPFNILLTGWSQIAKQWLIRKKKFHITAKIAVVQTLILNVTKTCIGWFHPLAAVLIILTTIGSAFHVTLLFLAGKRVNRDITLTDQSNSRTPMLEVAKRYYDFPLYRAPQVFINAISQSLPVLMLAFFFGPASAGYYAICRRILTMPSGLISSSFGDVFYPRLSEAKHKGENLTRIIVKSTFALAAISFLPFAIIVAFGPWLFEFVFGNEWKIAGEYARWLGVMSFCFFINKPAVIAVPILGLQKGLLIYELFSTGSKLLALYIGFIIFKNDKVAVGFFGIFGAVAYISLIAWVVISSALQEHGNKNV